MVITEEKHKQVNICCITGLIFGGHYPRRMQIPFTLIKVASGPGDFAKGHVTLCLDTKATLMRESWWCYYGQIMNLQQ